MKSIRIAIAQMNPTVGDISANRRKILSWIEKAKTRNSQLIVFPELAISGYPVWDLANKQSFLREGVESLERIVRSTRNSPMAVALGFIDRAHDLSGPVPARNSKACMIQRIIPQRSYNALAWIEQGKLRAVQPKRLLPTYDVFLEEVFFKPGKISRVIPWRGRQIGPTICEDVWDDPYAAKPLKDLARCGADWVINISASPYYRGVREDRDLVLKRQAVRYGLPILYVNQVGGQDDLIFDGRSLFVDAKGRVLFRAPAFSEGLFFFDWDPVRTDGPVPGDPASDDTEEIYQALILGIRDYCRKNNFRKVLLGLSGGIDSALVAVLAAHALGPEAVLGVTMPGPYSSCGSWQDSQDLAGRLGIECRVRPIREKYRQWIREDRGASARIGLARENLQARLRGVELMYLSNDEGRLLLSTGNKSELAMGYCTLYGDMAGGLCVLGDVYKTDVYRLARYCNREREIIPDSIIRKAPSAELRPNQTDQDTLPPYDMLDKILYLYIEKNKTADEIVRLLKAEKIPAKTVREALRKVDHNEYKRRQTPPILRVTEKAWFGRRMPITNRFER